MFPPTPPPLRLIDISPFLTPSSPPHLRAHTAALLSSACTTHGFFYLTHHNIPPALTARVLALARRFFTEASAAEKARIRRRDAGVGQGDGARGYQVVGENVTQGRRDVHEAVDWYRPVVDGEGGGGGGDESFEGEGEGREPPFELLRGVNAWPRWPGGFRDVYEEYVARMLDLGTAVVRAMGVALMGEEGGRAEVFVQASRRSWWVMRAIGYPPLRDGGAGAGDDEGISCGAHTDYGCLTLLLADETKGALQVERVGGGWIAADPVEGALVVNVGDMMERWTNGLWKSTRHRVVHRGEGFRVSVPFFFEPDWDAWVEPLEECVRMTGGVKKGEGVVYGEHLLSKVRGNFYAGETEGAKGGG